MDRVPIPPNYLPSAARTRVELLLKCEMSHTRKSVFLPACPIPFDDWAIKASEYVDLLVRLYTVYYSWAVDDCNVSPEEYIPKVKDIERRWRKYVCVASYLKFTGLRNTSTVKPVTYYSKAAPGQQTFPSTQTSTPSQQLLSSLPDTAGSHTMSDKMSTASKSLPVSSASLKPTVSSHPDISDNEFTTKQKSKRRRRRHRRRRSYSSSFLHSSPTTPYIYIPLNLSSDQKTQYLRLHPSISNITVAIQRKGVAQQVGKESETKDKGYQLSSGEIAIPGSQSGRGECKVTVTPGHKVTRKDDDPMGSAARNTKGAFQ